MNIVFLVATPLMTAFLLSVTAVPHKVKYTTLKRVRIFLSVCGLVTLWVLLAVLAPGVLSGEIYTYTLGGWSPFLGVALMLDALSYVIAVISVLVCSLGMFYSFSYMEHVRGLGKYDTFYFLLITGILGVLLTRDIFNMYIFLEILSVSLYVLISSGEKKENYRASLKYLILGGLSSALFLFAVGLIYGYCGSLNIDYISQGIQDMVQHNASLAALVFSLILVSMGVKSGIVPLHFWLPDAHSAAPSPISALQSGIAIKITVYVMLRLFPLFGQSFFSDVSPIIAYMGVTTAVVGTLLALVQKNIKRMLAYSSISQIGIIVIGIGISTDLALEGALFHIVNHALLKSGLFLCTGIIIHYSGTRDITRLRVEKMPGLVISFIIFSLGIVGIPPLNGFVSKFIICYGAVLAGDAVLAFLICAVSLVSCGYYFRVIQVLFAKKQRKSKSDFRVSKSMRGPVYVLAFLCVILGLFPSLVLNAVQVILGGG